MIAGPNGAGKTTLYRTELKHRHPRLPFVNADELAVERFGNVATTLEMSRVGQDLAEQCRRELMAAGASFFTESTFSHPSKLALLDDARGAGYRIFVYHVNVRDADLAVARVATRVDEGGHPVPEEKTRARYERNQGLIRTAVLQADRAWVYDNSQRDSHHRIAMIFHEGAVTFLGENVPAWARSLYSGELERFSPEQINAPAHSYDQARAFVAGTLGLGARTYVARPGGDYRGTILGETPLHVLQQVGRASAVAHFRDRLAQPVQSGARVRITYDETGRRAVVEGLHAPRARVGDLDAAKAQAFRTAPQEAALKVFPDLAGAYAGVRAFEAAMTAAGHVPSADQLQAVQERIAREIEAGRAPPVVSLREREDPAAGLERSAAGLERGGDEPER